MKYRLLLLLLFVVNLAFSQRKPNEFVEEAAPDSSNFEIYSQKNNLPRRANIFNLKKYFDQDIYISNDTICLTRAVGDTCLSLASFSQSLSVDSDSLYLSGGGAVSLTDISSATDDQGLSLVGDSLEIENGNKVSFDPFRQTVDSFYISGDKLYISLTDDNVAPFELNVADFLAAGSAADGNGIISSLPLGDVSIAAASNSLFVTSGTTYSLQGLNHLLTNGTSSVALLAGNRLSSVHNGYIHQNGLGTYAHYTNGTHSAILKLFGDEAEIGVSDQNSGVSGFKIFVTDGGVYNSYANAGGATTAESRLTSTAWSVRGTLSGLNNQPYIATTWADSSINILGKYDLANTTPPYAQSIQVNDVSGNSTWIDGSAIGSQSDSYYSAGSGFYVYGSPGITVTSSGNGVYAIDVPTGGSLEYFTKDCTVSSDLTAGGDMEVTIDWNTASFNISRATAYIPTIFMVDASGTQRNPGDVAVTVRATSIASGATTQLISGASGLSLPLIIKGTL